MDSTSSGQHPFVMPAYSLGQQQWGPVSAGKGHVVPPLPPKAIPPIPPSSNGFSGIPSVLPPRHTASQPAAPPPPPAAAYATNMTYAQMPYGLMQAASAPALDPPLQPAPPPPPQQHSRRAAAAAARATVVAAAADEEASSTDSGDFAERKPVRKKKQPVMYILRTGNLRAPGGRLKSRCTSHQCLHSLSDAAHTLLSAVIDAAPKHSVLKDKQSA
eukprot:1137147-Pelagomonas_calceolata.AAC.1